MSYTLPVLPYPYDALEPHIDSKTMEIHHSKHHQTYINNINAGIAGTEWEDLSVEALISKFNEVPQQLKQNVINNAGGHANHSLFWTVMSPDGGGHPEAEIAKAIEHELGGFEAFKDTFTQAALSRFGSGWAWLSVAPDQTLIVESSANQDSPLMHGNIPILGLDVWEHAYYLDYQNARKVYLDKVVDTILNWDYMLQNIKKYL